MGKGDGRLRRVDCLERGAIADMREVHEQPIAVQLLDHRPPELGEAGVPLLEAAVGQEVAGHVRDLDDPDAERGEHPHQALIALEGRRVLEAVDEPDAPSALAAGSRRRS